MKSINAEALEAAIGVKAKSFVGVMGEQYRAGYSKAVQDITAIIRCQPENIQTKDRSGFTNKQVLRKMDTAELAEFLNEPTCDHCSRQKTCGKKDRENCLSGIRMWLNLTYTEGD